MLSYAFISFPTFSYTLLHAFIHFLYAFLRIQTQKSKTSPRPCPPPPPTPTYDSAAARLVKNVLWGLAELTESLHMYAKREACALPVVPEMERLPILMHKKETSFSKKNHGQGRNSKRCRFSWADYPQMPFHDLFRCIKITAWLMTNNA